MFEYTRSQRQLTSRSNRSRKRATDRWAATGLATIVTMIEPSVERIIDGAANDTFANVSVDSIEEARVAMRTHSPRALLLSPSVVRQQSLSEIARLVAKNPGVTAIAVLGEDGEDSHKSLLELGACGVREVVNLADREGWNKLRALIENAGGDATSAILGGIMSSLEGATDDSRHFFATLVRLAPITGNVKSLATAIGIEASTLMSRFFRASLPAPKAYLSMTRLLYAASFFETSEASIADIAYRLNYSSPQSFGRNVRLLLGLTVGEYRREYSLTTALDHYVERLIAPYRNTFARFRPIGSIGNPCTERSEKLTGETPLVEHA